MTQVSPFALIGEYSIKRETYSAFTAAMAQLIRNLLAASGIDVLAIESRTKTLESFSDKVRSDEKAGKYAKLEDITDLCGLRVIAYLREDCDRICKIIQDNFEIDKNNSIDKGAEKEDQFGYTSRHFIVKLDKKRAILPEFGPFSDLKVEIQVRTVLQHAWAALDWRFRYKTAKEAPAEVRRKLFRISATLEGADENFSEVHQAVSDLREQYTGKVKSGQLDVKINAESLDSFLRHRSIVDELFEAFVEAGFIKLEYELDTLSRLLRNLEQLKITTLTGLEAAINPHKYNLKTLARIAKEEFEKAFPNFGDMGSSRPSAVRLAIGLGLDEDNFNATKSTLFNADALNALTQMRDRLKETI